MMQFTFLYMTYALHCLLVGFQVMLYDGDYIDVLIWCLIGALHSVLHLRVYAPYQ